MNAPQSKAAKLAATRARLRPNEALYDLANGIALFLSIIPGLDEEVSLSLTLGSWTGGTKIAFCVAKRSDVWVDDDLKGIWFGSTNVRLGWHELRQVADFLHLDIPQPELPAGQEVPR